ncbi:unnamed protein product [Prorocentrum cordatum]|uniref:Uncharacterized protein n=1 Tax=Prorocentrum cordatum TaxID=2364126 RepID=A0ABN9VJW2_9DINO|nr:unnamed protein product [Polarella glacialis]
MILLVFDVGPEDDTNLQCARNAEADELYGETPILEVKNSAQNNQGEIQNKVSKAELAEITAALRMRLSETHRQRCDPVGAAGTAVLACGTVGPLPPSLVEACFERLGILRKLFDKYEVAMAGWEPGCAARLEGLPGPRDEAKDKELERYIGSLPEGFEIDGPAPWVLRLDADGCVRAALGEEEQLPSHRFELPDLGGCNFAVTVRARNLEETTIV